jgi:hypothetical protein
MSEELTTQTRLNLATAKDEWKQALARAELLEIDVMEARQAAALANEKASRLSKVLAILDSDYVPEPIPVAPAPAQASPALPVAQPADPGTSVAEQIAAAAAAGDPLATRSADFSDGGREDRNAPPPANRPQTGPACPGCGRHGVLSQQMIMVGDRGPFNAIVCGNCGHQKVMI